MSLLNVALQMIALKFMETTFNLMSHFDKILGVQAENGDTRRASLHLTGTNQWWTRNTSPSANVWYYSICRQQPAVTAVWLIYRMVEFPNSNSCNSIRKTPPSKHNFTRYVIARKDTAEPDTFWAWYGAICLYTVKRHFYARVLFMRIMRGHNWSDKFVSHYIILA